MKGQIKNKNQELARVKPYDRSLLFREDYLPKGLLRESFYAFASSSHEESSHSVRGYTARER